MSSERCRAELQAEQACVADVAAVYAAEILRMHEAGRPDRASRLERTFDAIVARCLAIDPWDDSETETDEDDHSLSI